MQVLHENALIRARVCRHGVMVYPKADEHVGRSLDTYGEWAEAEIELLTALVPAGGVVLDVGANLGSHTVPLANKVGPQGAVFAFEPQRFVHDLLCATIALNALSWVKVEHAAVGDVAGSLVVPDIDYGATGNFGGLSLGSWSQGEPVRVITVDSLALTRCALVKIDVEGMELSVLSGASQTLRRHQPVVYVENNSVHGAPRVVELLQAHGYALFWHFSAFFRASNFAQLTEDRFQGLVDANMIAVPTSSAGVLRSLQPVEGPADTAQAALARRATFMARRSP